MPDYLKVEIRPMLLFSCERVTGLVWCCFYNDNKSSLYVRVDLKILDH